MREILYKAKTKYNGEWVKGDLIQNKAQNNFFIHPQANAFAHNGAVAKLIIAHEVEKDTICEYTGLTDKNGKMIFEGDIIKKVIDDEIFEIIYSKGYFCASNNAWWDFIDELGEVEVIGNIYDNPELHEQGDKRWRD